MTDKHKSDCAVYNAPAMPPEECNCGAMTGKLLTRKDIEALRAFPYCSSITKAEVESLADTALALMDENKALRLKEEVLTREERNRASKAYEEETERTVTLTLERDEIGAKYDESYSDEDYKVIREAVQTFSIRNTKLEAERDALAAANAELREAAFSRTYIRDGQGIDYRDERCHLCGAFWQGQKSDESGLVHGTVLITTAEHVERKPCPLATDSNERGKELLAELTEAKKKARKWDALEPLDPSYNSDSNQPLSRTDALRLCKMKGQHIDELEAEAAGLWMLVEKYSRHREGCPAPVWPHAKCWCGLREDKAALRMIRQAQEPKGGAAEARPRPTTRG